jgi:hypothetical protein
MFFFIFIRHIIYADLYDTKKQPLQSLINNILGVIVCVKKPILIFFCDYAKGGGWHLLNAAISI